MICKENLDFPCAPTISTYLKVSSVFFDFDHEVVDVDQLSPNGKVSEGDLGQHLLEAMVVLDQLSQCTLGGGGGGGGGIWPVYSFNIE